MADSFLDLWLIRHGETDWNRERRAQGHSHNPLSELGIKQARRLAQRLEPETFDRVYSSDLERALQTARIVFPDCEIVQDARLREIGRGILEGTTDAERTEDQRALLHHVRGDRLVRRPPGGENFQDVVDRVGSWLADLPERGKVIAFTHGGVIHAALHRLVGYSSTFSFAFNNTGISRLVLAQDHTTISFLNDHAHLKGREDLWSF
ncbi:histidine phosphatase family protein [soil metagenome]